MKEREAIYLVERRPNAGCWVMKLEDEEEREKIIVRSDGTVTYVGKDIAYQLWKFGLLERIFITNRSPRKTDRPLDFDGGAQRPDSSTSAARAGSTTSSTPAKPTFKKSSFKASVRSGLRTKPPNPSISPMRWSPFRRGASNISESRRGGKGPKVLSKSPDGKVWASKPTTSSTSSSKKPSPKSTGAIPTFRRTPKRRIAPDRLRRLTLFHAEIRPELPDRLRRRRRLELRGRNRALSYVYGRPSQQHLPQARGAEGHDRGPGPGRPPAGRVLASSRRKGAISGTSSGPRRNSRRKSCTRSNSLEFSTWPSSPSLCQKANAYYHRRPVLAEENPDPQVFQVDGHS